MTYIVTNSNGQIASGIDFDSMTVEWVEGGNEAASMHGTPSRKGAENMLALAVKTDPTAKLITARDWRAEIDAHTESVSAMSAMGERDGD